MGCVKSKESNTLETSIKQPPKIINQPVLAKDPSLMKVQSTVADQTPAVEFKGNIEEQYEQVVEPKKFTDSFE